MLAADVSNLIRKRLPERRQGPAAVALDGLRSLMEGVTGTEGKLQLDMGGGPRWAWRCRELGQVKTSKSPTDSKGKRTGQCLFTSLLDLLT